MGRNRVLSFMSQLSGRSPSPPPKPVHANTNTTTTTTTSTTTTTTSTPVKSIARRDISSNTEPFPAIPSSPIHADGVGFSAPSDNESQTYRPYGRTRSSSRPASMIQTYTPPVMDINDTIPELQPIFTFLNSHANKLYQEGYFLKLDDQNSHGRPNPDRNWTECFAQLVGTVLSLWDAAELDTAGEDGEVLPKFINLTDASIKMIDSLPTRTRDEQPLQNILSVSTAGRNRYLLHFNSHHSLIQWTASIRLAMFEQSSLQEAYTGALIAGKGKQLNNINLIMEKSRFKTEEWVRVRFGAGVPWRRCWCVVSPADEKEVLKMQKEWKKRSPYDRKHMPVLKGDIKFYDTKKEGKKQKKAKPIASITNAYAAYAIYPQSKALIDASTLIKIEGTITIHSEPPSATEGFVFVMPEVHPAVTGFEMLMRFLFPTWDTFGLYGRPGRLVASVLDTRSLMFAMPKHRRYGYLDLLDVSGLVSSDDSKTWSERDWRKQLKELTNQRMAAMDDGGSGSGTTSGSGFNSNRSSKRLSFGPSSDRSNSSSRPKVNFADDSDSARSSRSIIQPMKTRDRTDSAPPTSERQRLPSAMAQAAASNASHARNFSDGRLESHLPQEVHADPASSNAAGYYNSSQPPSPAVRGFVNDLASTPEHNSSEYELPNGMATPPRDLQDMNRQLQTPEPVLAPPAFNHSPSARPSGKPYHSPELRRANSRLSNTTLAQMRAGAGAGAGAAAAVGAGAAAAVGVAGSSRSGSGSGTGLPSPVTTPDWSPPDHDEMRPGSQSSSRSRMNGSRTDLTVPGPVPTAEPTIPILSTPIPSHPRSPGLPPANSMLGMKRSKSPLNQAQSANSTGPGPSYYSSNSNTPPPMYQESNLRPSTADSARRNQHLGTTPYPMVRDGRTPSPYPDGDGWHTPPESQGPPPPPPKSPQQLPLNPQNPQNPENPENPQKPQNPQKPLPLPKQRTRTPPPQAGSSAGASTQQPPLQASPPAVIHRKPLPPRADSLQRAKDTTTEPQSAVSSSGSLQDYYIDEAALQKVHYTGSDTSSQRRVFRQDTKRSEASSRYDDGASTASPDYASTHESIKTQESVERPRAGVLKTVGDITPPPKRPEEELGIPSVDFGPTILHAATTVPPRSKTPTLLMGPIGGTRSYSPASGSSGAGSGAAAGTGAAAPIRKSPRDQQRSVDLGHFRQDSDDTIRRRSVAWQPGAAVVGSSSPTEQRPMSISAEQFVMQRASQAAALPTYVHQRTASNNTLMTMRTTTPTPTLRRSSSYDMLNSISQPQPRPSSQGAASALGGTVSGMSGMGGLSSSADMSSHLSAREQEHLARMTGAPLINMAGGGRTPPTTGGAGLVGAIAAREREKQQMKEGFSSQAVQYAITQRQQMQYQQQAQAQAAQVAQAQQVQQAQQQAAQQQAAQLYGTPSPYAGFQMAQPQAQPQAYGQANFGQPMASGWPMMQGGQQAQFMASGSPQPGMQQGYAAGAYAAPSQARSRTPNAMGRGMMYNGQAF